MTYSPIRCLVVDDKPLALDILTDYVNKMPFLQLMGTFDNPLHALHQVAAQGIDLVFLDIQMPQLTGIQFMSLLNGQASVILTTAYAEYALEGFEHNVIDYLLKPISFERFYRAAQRAQGRLRPAPTELAANSRPYLFVKTEHRMQRVDLDDILYAEGLQNYVVLHTRTEKVIARQTFSSLVESLPTAAFVRVQKSFLVALAHIGSVERSRIFIQIEGKPPAVIPVGDTYRDRFYKLLSGR